MAKWEALSVVVPGSAIAGAATSIADMTSAVVTLTGSFTGTYQVQVSMDGTNFYNFGSALTAAGQLAITYPAAQVRLNCTAYTSSPSSCSVAGLRSRQVY